MLFGQKAKNVKTTVNVNEVALKFSTANATNSELQAELEKQSKTICELQAKIKHLEEGSQATSKKGRQARQMEGSQHGSPNQQSSEYLQKQVSFLTQQLIQIKEEVEQKDVTI